MVVWAATEERGEDRGGRDSQRATVPDAAVPLARCRAQGQRCRQYRGAQEALGCGTLALYEA